MILETQIDSVLMSHFADDTFKNRRIPLSGGIELMSKCNLQCVHCYEESCRWKDNLTTSQIKQIVDQLVEMGTLSLFLTGGEAMLRNDFDDIYRYIREQGILVTILTNGTTITEEKIALFKEYPPLLLDISIYGASEETYQQVCRVKGAFDRFMKGLSLLKNNSIPFTLKTVLMRENKHDLDAMRKIADSFDVGFKYFTNIRAMNDGNDNPISHMLTIEEIMAIEKEDPMLRHYYNNLDSYQVKHLPSRKNKKYCYLCNIAHNGFFIANDGIMYGCVRERLHGYDLTKGSFKEGWETHFVNTYINKITESESKCWNCENIKYCEYCPAQFELDTGDPLVPPNSFCELAKLRREYFSE